MIPSNFQGLRYFSPLSISDNWGPDPSKIDRGLLLKVEELREKLGSPIVVTSGYRPDDMGSQHALGLALDIIAPNHNLHDFYLLAESLNFKGIGVYPTWHLGGRTLGGLHVDERLGKPARWMGLGNDHSQKYVSLNSENMKKYGVIT